MVWYQRNYFNLNFIKLIKLFFTIIFLFIFLNYNVKIQCFKHGNLEVGVLNSYKYLYYGKQHVHLEDVVNFYLNNSSELKFKISQYRYSNQPKFIRYKYWDHLNFCLNSENQNFKDLLVNIMLTTNDFNSPLNITPNIIKLTDNNLVNSGKIQYHTNYIIALDRDLVLEQFHYYKKHKNDIDCYSFENKKLIIDNYTKILQKYKKL